MSATQELRPARQDTSISAVACSESVMHTGPLLRRKEVERETGLSRPTIYRLMSTGQFPRPRRIGLRAVAWSSTEIQAWKEALPRTEGATGGT